MGGLGCLTKRVAQRLGVGEKKMVACCHLSEVRHTEEYSLLKVVYGHFTLYFLGLTVIDHSLLKSMKDFG